MKIMGNGPIQPTDVPTNEVRINEILRLIKEYLIEKRKERKRQLQAAGSQHQALINAQLVESKGNRFSQEGSQILIDRMKTMAVDIQNENKLLMAGDMLIKIAQENGWKVYPENILPKL